MKEEVEKQEALVQGQMRTGHESASDIRARRGVSPTAGYSSFPSLWASVAAKGSSSALASVAAAESSGSGCATPKAQGSSSHLNDVGEAAAKLATAHILPKLRVWTSHLKRTMQTAGYIKGASSEPWKALNEIDAVRMRTLPRCLLA